MSRRVFIKWLLLLIGAIALMASLLVKLIQKAAHELPNRKAGGASPAPVPSAGAPGQPSPAASASDPRLSFFVLSDPHISPDAPQFTDRLKKAYADIQDFGDMADALVMTGDLADFGRDVDYQLFHKILKEYKLPPFMANMGNHDYYDIWLDKNDAFKTETFPNGKTDAMARARFMKHMGYDKVYNEFWVKGYHFLMLSQEAYQQEKKEVGEGAWYSDEQLAWLKQKLEPHRDGSPVFIGIHQPLPPAGRDGGSHQLIRNVEFREILSPYKNAFVFSGHHHREFTKEHVSKEPFNWVQNSSATRVRSPRKATNEFSQGLYVQVFADRVVIRGREFSNRTWMDDLANWSIPLV